MTPARDRLERVLAPEVVEAVVALVEELVDERLEALEASNGREWIPLREAAERERCSYDAMRMRVQRERVETRRVGRTVYVLAASLYSDPQRKTGAARLEPPTPRP